jgi:uncharacterized membrane protein YraQ (UPF0718 family)
MDFILNLIVKSAGQVWLTFLHNWPYLVLSAALAALLKLYLDPKKVSAFLLRYQKAGVAGATAVAVGTPLCSCGTTALVLGMIANMMPWAPVVAFMVASPLTSPQELVYSAGLFGWRFALAFFAASILLGFAGGIAAAFCERRGWLANQTRQSIDGRRESRMSGRANRAPGAVLRRIGTLNEPKPLYSRIPHFLSSIQPPAHLALEAAACSCESGAQLIALDSVGCGCDRTLSIQPLIQAQPTCRCSQPEPARPAEDTICDCAPFQAIQPALLGSPSCECGSVKTAQPSPPDGRSCGCSQIQPKQPTQPFTGSVGCGCAAASVETRKPVTLRMALEEMLDTGRRLLVMFLGFAFIGYFLNGLIPAAWVTAIFGSGNVFSVPLAATLGLPLYINSEASLPLVRAMLNSGMSEGAALAFLITGAGTSFGAVAGMLTIARWRVVALVVGTLWVGGLLFGVAYNLLF